MIHLDYCEFYITNVCNLACPGCNRFNNYKFKGTQRWEDYADVYAQWAKEISVDHMGVLGGEPLLNVDIMAWLEGLTDLWPDTYIKVVTNGYYLNKVKGLYDFLVKQPKVKLWVGIHNESHKPMITGIIDEFLQGPLQYEYNNDNPYQQYAWIDDANGVRIKLEYNWWFHQGALIPDDAGFKLHNSDVETAHAICHSKTCHHFVRGKLYKCGVVALLPEFAEQHALDISEEDRQLMMSYKPLTIDDVDKQGFIDNLPNSLAQCKFCPEKYHGIQIFAEEKSKERT